MSLIDRYFIKQPAVREFVTRMMFGDRDIDLDLFGDRVTVNALRENGYLRAMRASQRYSVFRDEAVVLQNLGALVKPDSTFVDVGANIGLFSIAMARLGKAKPGLDVVAYEVDPDTYERLALNAARHGFRAVNAGVSNRAGFNQFVRGAVSHVTTMVEKRNAYSLRNRVFEAEMTTLDAADLGDKPKMLKLDVEGAELEVLEGARGRLAAGEIYAVYCDGIAAFGQAKSLLAEYGFQFRDGRSLEPCEDETFAVLAVRPGR